MKNIFPLLIFFSSIINAQEWLTPVIEGYGKIKFSKDIAVQPENNLEYKLVYKITTTDLREGVNKGLNSIAHAINMLGCSNISKEKVEIVASISGPATSIILTDKAYKEKYNSNNPNSKIINLLSQYGVKLFVCSQATSYKNIANSQINSNIISALSGASVLANYQLNGFVFMP